ncbi:MAG: CCA tRNA nucleotidyltransferase [Clostridiales bacterium]|nr:CCA tRNA nucleotidyltransferase [Clostridiales bacterium]
MKKLTETSEKRILTMLEDAGYEAYFVGGCVRDSLRGGDFGDVDITTNARPEDIKRVFSGWSTIDTGIKHGTVMVVMGTNVEVTTYRSDGIYSDNRHPDKVEFITSLKEDLGRRDFTMNAIAMDSWGNLTDPFGGEEDIKAGVIRAVGNSQKRFEEDALRIMRALRFAAALGFAIEPETEEELFRSKELLSKVSAERIYAEFKKLIIGKFAGQVIRKYADVLGQLMPELVAMKGFSQCNPYHKYDVLEHCLRTMEAVRTDKSNKAYMRMAALFHDAGKPSTFFKDEEGVGHFYGHPAKSKELACGLLKRMKADGFTVERVGVLVKNHDLLFERNGKLLKRRLNKFGPEILLEILDIKEADNFATGNMSSDLGAKFKDVRCVIEKILEEQQCFCIKHLAVSGKDLIGLGVEEGPEIGAILDKLLEGVLEGRIPNKKDPLIEFIKRS